MYRVYYPSGIEDFHDLESAKNFAEAEGGQCIQDMHTLQMLRLDESGWMEGSQVMNR